ncbi:MAG: TolC family protein, partial [Gemmatimonadota bacterium]
ETALAAAQGHVRQARSMVTNGLVTRSDALLAEVRAGDVEAELAAARADAILARDRLAVLLGDIEGRSFELPDSLPPSSLIRVLAEAELADSAGAARHDVQAAELGLDAAEADMRRARSLYLPRVNSFGRYDWNSPTAVFGGKAAWTVGVMVSWSPFAGAGERAELKAAAGRREAARARVEAARAQARLEATRAVSALRVALLRLAIAERSVAQATEAHRIVTRKYEGGLAAISELLDAQAAETAARLAADRARYDAITAIAEHRRSTGRDLMALAVLEEDSAS